MTQISYRAAICTALSGPDSIRIEDQAVLPLQPGQVRLAVKAAGLNFPDLLMTYGKYQFRPEPPFVPGMELAGEVLEVAPDVTRWRVGDRVSGGNKNGAFAEQIILDATLLRPLSAALSFEEGACWQAAAVTAWHALHDKADLKAGESVLVLGASGGVGMAAVGLARHRDAVVIGTGSTAEKRAAILAAGADHVLDPADPDLAAKVKGLTGGKGVDVVYDPVGGDLAITATRAIAYGGRYLIVGFASGTIPQFPANHAMIKGYSLIGLRAGESSRRDPDLAERTRIALTALADQGVMRPHISHRFALDQAADALKVMETRSVIGRAVITMA
ncbi:MAG: NADPH:quinone oxidoreductase family protein [Sphingomonadales bacterium]|nr:NADPH:quinone oxidoreductase family protein [Sphingomonadales bacterium]